MGVHHEVAQLGDLKSGVRGTLYPIIGGRNVYHTAPSEGVAT